MQIKSNVLDLFKLSGMYAFVSGGAKGLGTHINEGLLEAGVNLIFCGRGRHGSLEDEKNRLDKLFPETRIISIQTDISDENSVISMVTQLKEEEKIGKIDILVNNAGVTWAAPSIDQTLTSWHRVMDINLTGTFLLTREIAREFMIPYNGGTIINISSVLAFLGTAEMGQVGYSASKAGLLGLTRQLAVEWAKFNIRINSILLNFVETEESMAKVFTNKESPVRETLLDMIPARKFVQPDDLKAVICFLASKASSIITGQSIILDGGYSVK